MNDALIRSGGISGLNVADARRNRPIPARATANADAGKTGAAAKTETPNVAAEMTMDEYKTYIHEKISALPVHPTQASRSAAVFISEEGFAAMKENPEYEDWVLGKLQEDFAVCDPVGARCGSYAVYQFGAEKNEYRGHSWYADFQGGQGERAYRERSEGSFWERRAAARKEAQAKHDADVREQKRLADELERERAELFAAQEKISAKGSKAVSAALSSYDAHSVFLGGASTSSMPVIVTKKKVMPDGTIIITTKKDGKIVSETKKKPHLVPVPDPTAPNGIRMEPMQNIFEGMM